MDALFSNNSQRNTSAHTEDLSSVYEAVGYIQVVMAVLSILGSGSIIVFAVFQRVVRSSEVWPLFLLSVTDLLLAVCWLTGSVLFLKSCSTHGVCYNLHNVEQTLYMASFFFTLHYVWALYTGLWKRFNRHVNGFPAQSAALACSCAHLAEFLSLATAIVLTVPVYVTGNMERCYINVSQPYRCLLMQTESLLLVSPVEEERTACLLVHRYRLAIFLLTFIFTLIGIIVLMGKARSLYKRCITSNGFFGDRQWATLHVLEKRMLLYPAVFLLCWAPAVVLGTVMLFKPEAAGSRFRVCFYILQALTSTSQGWLNCVVYGWTQRHFRSLSGAGMRDADTQTPLLRSQKKNSYSALYSFS
ncbi:transmembrane protein 116 [Chanos chanos]|uniref:Transmembrane protein 116 n=1 Tax=Chanos chanos TaxID=29144 RepID=A0A6J2VS04_CHACN|nr:transmembrane protein 116 [Chanos chanos]